jgi:hypothetical protein
MRVVCPLIGGRSRMPTQQADREPTHNPHQVRLATVVRKPRVRYGVMEQTHHHSLTRTFSRVR